jgi:transcriptional regulator with GAF, ATPase, and Fis domain
MRLILEVWREVCRHLEIHESVERLLATLAAQIPLEALAIRRVDRQRSCLETVACGVAEGGAPIAVGKTSLNETELTELLEWFADGRVTSWQAGVAAGSSPNPRWFGSDPASPVASRTREAEIVVGPLASEEGTPLGLILIVGAAGGSFSQMHRDLVQELLEPFAAALENDSRLREMQSLREALEADKQALLSRLDRQDITESIVGAETGLGPVMERVEQVAPSDVPVLLLGETGSGKEVIARAIHHRSPRASGPILRVNCGAIPPELIDSELFGHERGSFTGASATRQGWFERADGGTLFLDEIGELPPAAQVRMLRVLQDGSFERVGGNKPITVDVRLVAATNADLPDLIAKGKFRDDLWYRINVFPIHLPSLRQRPDDIPAFAAHFAARAGKRLGGRPLVPTPRDVELLSAYSWPGNVRELAAVIERAAILGSGRRLEIAKALGTPAPAEPATPSLIDAEQPLASRPSPVGGPVASLEQAMKQHIESTLAVTFGRVEGPFGAARLLGINPHTLRSRMRKLGIDWTQYRTTSDVREGDPPGRTAEPDLPAKMTNLPQQSAASDRSPLFQQSAKEPRASDRRTTDSHSTSQPL